MAELDPNVTYRPIPSLPAEFYRAGDDGSAWSCQKKGRGAGKVGEWRRLKPQLSGTGYHVTRIGVNNVRNTYYIHNLIAQAFLGPCPDGMEVCHENGDRLDNRPSNLRWGTRRENIHDKARHGTQIMGSQHYRAKVTEADVPVIRERLARGEGVGAIAESLSIPRAVVEGIHRGRSWKHVP